MQIYKNMRKYKEIYKIVFFYHVDIHANMFMKIYKNVGISSKMQGFPLEFKDFPRNSKISWKILRFPRKSLKAAHSMA